MTEEGSRLLLEVVDHEVSVPKKGYMDLVRVFVDKVQRTNASRM